MIGIDGTETQDVTIAGVRWTVGLIPARKLARLERALYDAVLLPAGPGGQRTDDAIDLMMAARGEIVRWGVRGWDLPRLPKHIVGETFAGETFEILDHSTVDVLARIDEGSVLVELAEAVRSANHLTRDELLGFR